MDDGRTNQTLNLQAHSYHKPRAKVSLPITPSPKNTDSLETNDLPSNRKVVQPENFQIDIPENYQAVMRKDYFTESYVIIAPKRHLRPLDFAGSERRLIETASSPRLDLQTEIDSIKDRQGNWKTKVVDNKFPALSFDNSAAYGKQEIVIDTPLANTPLGKVGRDQLLVVLQTYQRRTRALMSQRGIKYVVVFKNDGVRAGASLAHSHSQIFATPLIPTKTARISQAVETYFQKTGKKPYDAILEFEQSQSDRIIAENNEVIAFCPFASRWPLDTWITLKKHRTSISELDDTILNAIADILYPIINKLTRYHIDYNFYLENGVSPNHRFTIKVQARSLNWWAGFEIASDIAINPIPPEVAAQWYRSPK